MLAATILSVVFSTAALAAPSIEKRACDISNAAITFPPGQTALAVPTIKPSYIAVALGTQNYTCSSTGTYTYALLTSLIKKSMLRISFRNVGALAELFDASCVYNTPLFPKFADTAYALWKALPSTISAQSAISSLHLASTSAHLGQHYHIVNPTTGTGVIAKWDFTSQGATAGNADAFVVASKVAGLAAPTGTQDIDWVSLKGIQGKLASDVYRVDTRGGQPPASVSSNVLCHFLTY